jgi:transcriptional regulatory protein LevR
MKAICMQLHGSATARAVADKANRVLNAGIVFIF